MTARDELYAYATVAFKDYEVPDIVRKHVDRLIDAHRAEVLAEAADVILAEAALRETEGETELAAYGRELAQLIQPDTKEQP